MAVELTARAAERGTYTIVATCIDEEEEEVVPLTLTWTLLDDYGQVVNGRQDVVVDDPTATVNITLEGADLAHTGNNPRRSLVVTATYNSTLGNGLTMIGEARFEIEDRAGVSG